MADMSRKAAPATSAWKQAVAEHRKSALRDKQSTRNRAYDLDSSWRSVDFADDDGHVVRPSASDLEALGRFIQNLHDS